MARSFSTMLMFEGSADAAMQFYVSLFSNASVEKVERYAAGEAGAAGSIKHADFVLGDQRFACIDSPAKHGFTFTPSMSIVVQCDGVAEFETLFTKLSEGGKVMMEPANYGFSTRFCWCADRFGVSWQLNVA